MGNITYVYDGTYPDLGSAGPAFQLSAGSTVDAATVAKLAALLGVQGDVRTLPADQGGGWQVGPADYSGANLTVAADGHAQLVVQPGSDHRWSTRAASVACPRASPRRTSRWTPRAVRALRVAPAPMRSSRPTAQSLRPTPSTPGWTRRSRRATSPRRRRPTCRPRTKPRRRPSSSSPTWGSTRPSTSSRPTPTVRRQRHRLAAARRSSQPDPDQRRLRRRGCPHVGVGRAGRAAAGGRLPDRLRWRWRSLG